MHSIDCEENVMSVDMDYNFGGYVGTVIACTATNRLHLHATKDWTFTNMYYAHHLTYIIEINNMPWFQQNITFAFATGMDGCCFPTNERVSTLSWRAVSFALCERIQVN